METVGKPVEDQQVPKYDQVSQLSLDINKLSNSLRGEIHMLHSFSDQCCIYKVPIRIRVSNEKIFTPQLVSLGPLHHGKEELKGMEEHKILYLQDFLNRRNASLEELIKVVEEKESRMRNCYTETIDLGSEDFVKMMLLDASFIIEVLLKDYGEEFGSSNDRIFNKPWKLGDISLDMCMIENQLPFFILEDLFKASGIASCRPADEEFSVMKLTFKFFARRWGCWLTKGLLEINSSEVAHFVDFIRKCQKPSESDDTEKKLKTINVPSESDDKPSESDDKPSASDDTEKKLKTINVPSEEDDKPSESDNSENELKTLNVPSVTELHQAGVEFRNKPGKSLLDMKFDRGVLEMPTLRIDDDTEIILRNLQAFEQCHCKENYIGNYISMINFLVITPNDVDILVRNGIIENWIHDNEAVMTLLHNVSKENDLSKDDFIYAGLINDLNSYCRRPWNKWKATLKQEYFHTPWAIISVIAAVILLILTVVQTVCSIISV